MSKLRDLVVGLAVVALLPMLTPTERAEAALINLNFEGTVSQGNASLPTVSVGDLVSGTFVYDTSTPLSGFSISPASVQARYPGAFTSMTLRVGDYLSGTTAVSGTIHIVDGITDPDTVYFGMGVLDPSSSGLSLDGLDLSGAQLRYMYDGSRTLVSGTSLPSSLDFASVLGEFPHEIAFVFGTRTTPFSVNLTCLRTTACRADASSAPSDQVPTPASLGLTLLGLMGFAIIRRRRKG